MVLPPFLGQSPDFPEYCEKLLTFLDSLLLYLVYRIVRAYSSVG
jgi:hypothetical protein